MSHPIIKNHLSVVSKFLTNSRIKNWITVGPLLDNDNLSDIGLGIYVQDANQIMSLNPNINQLGYNFHLPYTQIMDSDFAKVRIGPHEISIWEIPIEIEYMGNVVGNIYLFKNFDDEIIKVYNPNVDIYINYFLPNWYINDLDYLYFREVYYRNYPTFNYHNHWHGNPRWENNSHWKKTSNAINEKSGKRRYTEPKIKNKKRKKNN